MREDTEAANTIVEKKRASRRYAGVLWGRRSLDEELVVSLSRPSGATLAPLSVGEEETPAVK